MCGVIGCVSDQAVAQLLCDALTLLQHRGQDATGMMTCDQSRIYQHKGLGLVRDVFKADNHHQLLGHMGIAHLRYPTAGCGHVTETQPFYVNAPYGLGISHNGQLVNTDALRQLLKATHHRHLNTDSDSEVLLNLFAHELQTRVSDFLDQRHLFDTIAAVMRQCVGSYAVVMLVADHGVLGFRDPWGIRPLILGRRNQGDKPGYMLASESVALDVLGYEVVGDVLPGEAVYISHDGVLHRQQCVPPQAYTPCLFEYIYLASDTLRAPAS